EIHIIVPETSGINSEVVDATHRHHTIDQIRPAKEKIGGMQCPQGSTGYNDRSLRTGMGLYVGNDLGIHVMIIGLVTDSPVMRHHIRMQPAFRINTVDTEYLDFSTVDIISNCID